MASGLFKYYHRGIFSRSGKINHSITLGVSFSIHLLSHLVQEESERYWSMISRND